MDNNCNPADPNCHPGDSYSKLLGLGSPKRMVGRMPVRGTHFSHVMFEDGTCCCHDHCGQQVPHHVVAAAAAQAANAHGQTHGPVDPHGMPIHGGPVVPHGMVPGHHPMAPPMPMHGGPMFDPHDPHTIVPGSPEHAELLHSMYGHPHGMPQSTGHFSR